MLGNIQTYFFFSLIHTKRRKDSDDRQTNQCTDNCNRRSHHNTDDLCQQKMIIAIDKNLPAGHTVDRALGKETGSNATPDTANAMTAKSVQCIINFQLTLQK